MGCQGDGWIDHEDEDGLLLAEPCPGCEMCAGMLHDPALIGLLDALERVGEPDAQARLRRQIPVLIEELLQLRAQVPVSPEPNPTYASPHPVIAKQD